MKLDYRFYDIVISTINWNLIKGCIDNILNIICY